MEAWTNEAAEERPRSDRGPRQNQRGQEALAQARNVAADLVPPPSREARKGPELIVEEEPTMKLYGFGFVLGVCTTLLAGWWFTSPPAAPALFESSCHGAGGVFDPAAFVITNGSLIWTQATCITDPAKFESKEHFLAPMVTARW
jgi:hypothetical protein